MPQALSTIELASFVYRNPAHRLLFGWNALERLREEVSAIACRKPMLVCSERAAGSPAAEMIVRSLGIAPDGVFRGVQSHAPLSTVLDAWKQARVWRPDCFVVLGGGSAVDTAKAIALAFAEDGRVLDFVLKRSADGRLQGRPSLKMKLPIVAIPTTLSGAEVTPSFTVTEHTGRKVMIRDASLAPSVLLYDPALVRAVPLPTLAPSVMNALAHGVEALYSKGRNPISAMFASEGVSLLHGGFTGAIAASTNDDAYASLTLGAYYAGVAIVNARTGLHHAICHKLAPAAGISHGIANSIVLPRVLEFNLPAARAELTHVARLIRKEAAGAEDAISELERLASQAGLPRRLREVRVGKEIFPALAEKIMSEPGLAFNPRPLDSAREIEEILNAAW
jgi:alcohol dehydrogenase class IV